MVEIARDPTDAWNWGALGADAACAFVPFVSGGGMAMRGARAVNAIDNAADAVKAADRTHDYARTIGGAWDATRADDGNRWAEAATAARKMQKGVAVIGPRSIYREFAEGIGARYLKVSDEAWTWTKNRKFLYGVVKRGDDVVFAGKFDQRLLRPGTALDREIKYLTQQGYEWTEDLSRLVRRG